MSSNICACCQKSLSLLYFFSWKTECARCHNFYCSDCANKSCYLLPTDLDRSEAALAENTLDFQLVQTCCVKCFLEITERHARVFHDDFQLGDLISKGAFGKVYQARTKNPNRRIIGLAGEVNEFAVKVIEIPDRSFSLRDVNLVRQEVRILHNLSHRNIAALYDYYEEEKEVERKRGKVKTNFYYLVTEFISGGELFDRIRKRYEGNSVFSEKEARDIVYKLLVPIEYLHRHNVVHR